MPSSTTSKYSFLESPIEAGDLGALGPYRVISELGRGGMGFVFHAEDTRLKRSVALKMMNRKIAATTDSRRRFIEEARSMAAVKHDNVATIYEVNDQLGTPFMAMELLQGGTLEQRFKIVKQFDYQTVIRYATEIARGLSAAHAQGIIHRDIKPANIWIEANSDRVKILDFGLALANVTVDQLAARGSVIGTPQYLSPEQASSEPLDDRTDLYSLGVVLFELCAGHLPFQAKNVAEQLIATLVHKPVPVNKINPQIPEPLSALIAKLLEKEPRRRPSSALILEQQLAKVAVECEAKSDVALAINKLQSQLSMVATKQPDPFAEPASAAFGEDAFKELPLPAPVTAASLTPTIPVAKRAPVQSFGRPAAASNKSSQVSLAKYWPFAAVGVVLLVMLAIVGGVWYGTLSATTRVGNVTITPLPSDLSPPQPPAPTNSSNPVSNQSQKTQTPVVPPVPTITSPVVQTEKPSVAPVDETPQRENPTKKSPPANTNKQNPKKNNVDDLSSGSGKSQVPETMASPSQKSLPEASEVMKKERPIASETLSRSSADGRGADTTVRRGASKSEQRGQDISIAVQSRGTVDIQHSYIRFDTKGLPKYNRKVIGAELVLHLPGAVAPAGSKLRVYGVPEELKDDWAEVGPRSLQWSISMSREPFPENSLLAEVEFTGEEPSSEIRIRDERMTDFVSGIKEEFVSFVLAGGSPENKPLYFVSREGDETRAPAIHIEFADKK